MSKKRRIRPPTTQSLVAEDLSQHDGLQMVTEQIKGTEPCYKVTSHIILVALYFIHQIKDSF